MVIIVIGQDDPGNETFPVLLPMANMPKRRRKLDYKNKVKNKTDTNKPILQLNK